MDAYSRRPATFPWDDLIPQIAVGIPSALIALMCTALVASWRGPQYDVVFVNDHVIGGTEDQLAVIVVGSLFGAAAVFCALRIWSRIVEWRRTSAAHARIPIRDFPEPPNSRAPDPPARVSTE